MPFVNSEALSCPLCGSKEALPLLEILSARMVRCQGCSLAYRTPLAPPGPLASTFAGELADLELEERVGERRSGHFRRFLAAAGQPGKLLDAGCGYGFFLKLAQEAGWEAIGVDLDPRAVAYAKGHLRVNALEGDLRDFHFPDGSFDLVTLWNVLDFVPDPLDLMREVHRLLRVGGQVFIRTPNATWHLLSSRLVGLLKRLGWAAVFGERPYTTFVFHLTSFSPSTLRLVIERAGFVALRIRNSPPVKGDPYLGFGPGGERLLSLAKLGVHGFAQGVSVLSGGSWLIGPSLEASARREG
jgi:SAM-dependent methyltransferase